MATGGMPPGPMASRRWGLYALAFSIISMVSGTGASLLLPHPCKRETFHKGKKNHLSRVAIGRRVVHLHQILRRAPSAPRVLKHDLRHDAAVDADSSMLPWNPAARDSALVAK